MAREERRIWERNNSADTKVSAEGGGGRAPGARAEIPLHPMVKTIVMSDCPPAAHGGPRGCRDPLAAHGGDPVPERRL